MSWGGSIRHAAVATVASLLSGCTGTHEGYLELSSTGELPADWKSTWLVAVGGGSTERAVWDMTAAHGMPAEIYAGRTMWLFFAATSGPPRFDDEAQSASPLGADLLAVADFGWIDTSGRGPHEVVGYVAGWIDPSEAHFRAIEPLSSSSWGTEQAVGRISTLIHGVPLPGTTSVSLSWAPE